MVSFVSQFYPVCNFAKIYHFQLGTVKGLNSMLGIVSKETGAASVGN